MHNELIRDSIYELVQAGVLDPKATNKKLDVVIEELVNKVYT
jgi:hypothetical protein